MSKSINFTKDILDNFICPVGRSEAYLKDSGQPGLLFRVRASGHRSFEVRKKLHGRAKRTKIGNYPGTAIKEARKRARDALGLIDRHIDPNAAKRAERVSGVTLGDCLDDYLESRSNLRKSTSDSYEATIKQYLSDWLNRPLKDITRDLVETRHRKIGKTSPTRANTTMRILRAVYNYAIAKYENEFGDPVFLHNPVARLSHVKAWYPETRKDSYLNKQQLPVWFDAVESLPQWMPDSRTDASTARDYLKFLLFTGLRRREASNLLWENVDLHSGTFTIIQSDAKNHNKHTLPLPKYLASMLAKRDKNSNPYVFCGFKKDRPLVEPKRVINAVRKRCDFSFTIHDLRRTFVTFAEEAGVRDYTLKRLINHKGGRDVTAGYFVPDVGALADPMEKVCRHILMLAKFQTEPVVEPDLE